MSTDGSSVDISVYCPSLFTWHHSLCIYFFVSCLCPKVLKLSFIHFMPMPVCHTCAHAPSCPFFWAWLSFSLSLLVSGSLRKTLIIVISFSLLMVSHAPHYTHTCLGAASRPSSKVFNRSSAPVWKASSQENRLEISAAHQALS